VCCVGTKDIDVFNVVLKQCNFKCPLKTENKTLKYQLLDEVPLTSNQNCLTRLMKMWRFRTWVGLVVVTNQNKTKLGCERKNMLRKPSQPRSDENTTGFTSKQDYLKKYLI